MCSEDILLPFKDQVSATAVRRQLPDLSHKICPTFQPVFISKKLEQDLKPKKPSRQSSISSALFIILYLICAMQIISAEHKNSAIGKHYDDAHSRSDLLNENHPKILRKSQGRFDR